MARARSLRLAERRAAKSRCVRPLARDLAPPRAPDSSRDPGTLRPRTRGARPTPVTPRRSDGPDRRRCRSAGVAVRARQAAARAAPWRTRPTRRGAPRRARPSARPAACEGGRAVAGAVMRERGGGQGDSRVRRRPKRQPQGDARTRRRPRRRPSTPSSPHHDITVRSRDEEGRRSGGSRRSRAAPTGPHCAAATARLGV